MKMVRSFLGCIAAGATLLSFSASANAALLVHEPFDYAAGANALNSQNGGTGYSAGYTATNNADVVSGSFSYTSS